MHAEEWRQPSVQWYTSNHTGFLCKDFYHESSLQYTVAIRNKEVVYVSPGLFIFSFSPKITSDRVGNGGNVC